MADNGEEVTAPEEGDAGAVERSDTGSADAEAEVETTEGDSAPETPAVAGEEPDAPADAVQTEEAVEAATPDTPDADQPAAATDEEVKPEEAV